MILSLFYYLLFSALFYAIYKLSYARLSFHKTNRLAVLSLPLIALAIALFAPRFDLPPLNEKLDSFQLPEIVIEGESLKFENVEGRAISSSWTLVYTLGLILSLIYFIIGLLRFRKLLLSAKLEQELGSIKIFWSKHIDAAFCFTNYIFLPAQLKEHKDLPLIIEHEKRHIQFGHVWDRLFYKLLSTLLWFDPFVHAFSRELRQIHEFEVDADLIRHQEIENYAQTLLRSTLGADLQFPEKALAPSPFFNSSLIKSRITMMYSNQSRPWRKALYALLIPITVGMILIACNKTESQDHVVVGVENKAQALSIEEIDAFPIAEPCAESSSAEDRKSCVFQSVYNHISENFVYPSLAKEHGLEGKIFISFVIEVDGSIGDVEVIKSIEVDTEELKMAKEQAETQAMALIKTIPSFASAASKDGKSVRMQLVIPIALKLT
ncbi:MAG: M56 family metallopeptidase [Croceimicrobium sp.]